MIRFRDPDSFAVIEPRIRHVQRELERILALVDLEMDGRPVAVNGFRLRELEPWRSYTTNTAMNALTPISGLCNSKCVFCFEEGIPLPREQSLMPVAEARTRLKYYSPEDGRCLFPSNRPNIKTFIHPQAVEIIEMARAREPEKLFWITSNGSHFEERAVARLAQLKPIIFKLSLNVVDETLNRELMKTGRRTPIALEAPKLLRKYEVPFMGSIVAWPTIPLNAIEDTVRYLESLEAYAVRIRLPLSHRWLNDQSDADFYARWQEVSDLARRLRPQCRVPLFVEPPIYWSTRSSPRSTASSCTPPRGVQASRPGTSSAPSTALPSRPAWSPRASSTRPTSTAAPSTFSSNARANCTASTSNTSPRARTATPTIPLLLSRRKLRHLPRRGLPPPLHRRDVPANRALRRPQRPALQLQNRGPDLRGPRQRHPRLRRAPERRQPLHIATVAENTAGGNYDVMDSRFVDDYARIIGARLDQGLPLDLILVPDAFGSPWGMDMGGRSCAEIEQETGIPVERIDWLLVYGREV